jgi:uncharacterized protein (DUF952 family)
MTTILHISSRADWLSAQTTGSYEADSLSSEGFIHCSRPDQVLGVANTNNRFEGQTDLILLCIDPDQVVAEIRYENLDGGDNLFPHIYGPLNVDAIKDILEFVPDNNGVFTLPQKLLR